MRIFGPLVCSTRVAVTEAAASAVASVVTASPSTRRTTGRVSVAPGSPLIFSTVSTSPSATLYCFPPVLTIAYIDALLLARGLRRQPASTHPHGWRVPQIGHDRPRRRFSGYCTLGAVPRVGLLLPCR